LSLLVNRDQSATQIRGRNANRNKPKSKNKLNFGAWNVRTLLDGPSSIERRTAIVTRVLAAQGIDIAALSECRLPAQSQLTEVGAGYTIYWSGRQEGERAQSGVGFAVRSALVPTIVSLPKGVSDRLMTMRIELKNDHKLTIISVYAPTMTHEQAAKDQFYEELEREILRVPQADKLLILGDFNARVGKDFVTWEGVLGHHGVGKQNENGDMLLRLCMQHRLLITNTVYQQNDNRKTSWMHPRSGDWHLIDYALSRRRDRAEIHLVRTVKSTTVWSDHRLVKVKTCFKTPPRTGRRAPDVQRRNLHTEKLSELEIQNQLQFNIDNTLGEASILPADVGIEDCWTRFSEAVLTSANQTLGVRPKQNKDWFDDGDPQIKPILEELHSKHLLLVADKNNQTNKDRYCEARSRAQKRIRNMKNEWWTNRAEMLQEAADKNNYREFYKGLSEVHGPTFDGVAAVFSQDRELLTEPEAINNRWMQHFRDLLNRPSTMCNATLSALDQAPVMEELVALPRMDELREAILNLKVGKACGPDGIPPEIYKYGGNTLTAHLHALFIKIWEQESVPQAFKDALIIHLYKRKGDRRDCGNHRGISLLSIAGKILARILVMRIGTVAESIQPESQCGFRSGRGTIDMIFAARQIQEKCYEQRRDLIMIFIDFKKAFDSVSRTGLWELLKICGLPLKLVNIIKSFHEGMMARVVDKGSVSDPFVITNGVKQGCVMAPILFGIVIAYLVRDAMSRVNDGIDIRFRCDGGLFNLRRLKSRTKTQYYIIKELLFADDCALVAHDVIQAQRLMDAFADSAKKFGLSINISKTEFIYQSVPANLQVCPVITVDGDDLKSVDRFCYLGATLTTDATADADVQTRIARASAAFGKFEKRLWGSHDISLNVKISVYKAVILTVLLYGAETWTCYTRHIRKLEAFHMRCLRHICGITWQQKIPNTDVLERCRVRGIESFIMESRLRWSGHVHRMSDERIPKMLLYGELRHGERPLGAPRKRYKDQLRETLKKCHIENFEGKAIDRSAWRREVREGATTFEENRVCDLKEKRRRRKRRIPGPGNHPCERCDKICGSAIGLISHMRTHI